MTSTHSTALRSYLVNVPASHSSHMHVHPKDDGDVSFPILPRCPCETTRSQSVHASTNHQPVLRSSAQLDFAAGQRRTLEALSQTKETAGLTSEREGTCQSWERRNQRQPSREFYTTGRTGRPTLQEPRMRSGRLRDLPEVVRWPNQCFRCFSFLSPFALQPNRYVDTLD